MMLSEHISIQYEEYEALRLADYENLSHQEAAKRMEVSRPTFTRMYEQIRKKLARAFVEGKTVLIEGGNVEFDQQWYRCTSCHTVFHVPEDHEPVCTSCGSTQVENNNESLKIWQGRRQRQGHGWQQAEEKSCICPSCHTTLTTPVGIPCREYSCPNCGHYMTRGFDWNT